MYNTDMSRTQKIFVKYYTKQKKCDKIQVVLFKNCINLTTNHLHEIVL